MQVNLDEAGDEPEAPSEGIPSDVFWRLYTTDAADDLTRVG